jgi:YVTN family beta-propeller protein
MAPLRLPTFVHLAKRATWLGLVPAMSVAAAAAFGGCDTETVNGEPTSSAAGGNGGTGADGGGGAGGAGGGPVYVLTRPSKSGTVDISTDDATVAMVNPEHDSVSFFATESDELRARVATGDEPSNVVIHPDGVTAFVANRADATVVKVSGIDGTRPVVSAPTDVGSEPTGLALSPTGALLFVAEWAEGRVSVIDTATMAVTETIAVKSPRGLTVTNDGDEDDTDELLIVPEFYGEPQPGGESTDTGRVGVVHFYSTDGFGETTTATLAPRDSTFGMPATMTSPNQLSSAVIAGGKVYITSVSASPAPPIAFNTNVQPVVYVIDLESGSEDTSPTGTTNLAALVRDGIQMGQTRFFLADIVDASFVGDGIEYVVSRGANVLQRVEWDSALGTPQIGSSFNKQIDLNAAPMGSSAGCSAPTGVVTGHENEKAYINCWVSRRLGVVDLTTQQQVVTVESAPPPGTAEEISQNKGLKFFLTGRGRWSSEAWSGCASCHPDGLSDNITWSFPAGPRQTTSLDGTFSKGPGTQKQRILNWTAIFDEIHDFERNTRTVSGGKGAVTTSATNMCGDLTQETPAALPGPPGGFLAQPVKEIQDQTPGVCVKDWDDIFAWFKIIRPPRAKRGLDSASIANGKALFLQGGCDKCHSGPGWTVSRLFWAPSSSNNAALTINTFPVTPFPNGFPASWNEHTHEIEAEPGTGFAPFQVACVLRNVLSFGVPGDAAATTALEKKDSGAVAQGQKGYNVPSLYGLALGAPYLHHGQAESLEELLDPAGAFSDHLQAGNAVFVPDSGEIADLVAFLTSIDADATEVLTPSGFDVCRATFP